MGIQILLILFSLIGLNSAITCYNASFQEVTNFMAFENPEVINCGGFCVSQYQNDGQTMNYTLRCDDSTSYCSIIGKDNCKDDYGSSTKTCCCSTDLCVHKSATDPIIYDLTKITFSSATAAYQVEGGAWDNRGPSIWDTYSHLPNKIHNNDTGDDACKSYYKWQDDVQLLKNLNVQQYRFSISWSRIFIDGTNNTINEIGVKYYSDLINALLAAGIEPVITMFHWDLPQSLMDLGGWLNENTAVKFGEYADFIFSRFGDRVHKWIPINEPLSVVQGEFCGDNGAGAPGEFAPHCAWSLYLAAKTLLLAHSNAWKAFQRQGLDKTGVLGMALNGPWFFPNDLANPDDVEASKRGFDFYWGLFGHPLFVGDWAPRVKDRIAYLSKNENRTDSRLPEFTLQQKHDLLGSAQFVGVNYYNGLMVTSRTDYEEDHRWELDIRTVDYDTRIRQWPAPEWRQMNASDPWVYYTPFGLRKLLNYIKDQYNVPILITENGCMDNYDEELNDVTRVYYLRGHLMACAQALQDGVKLMGHTVWSLMDNFEWGDGYSTKFGIHRVDFKDPDRARTPKASAAFYGSVAKSKMLQGFSINSRH